MAELDTFKLREGDRAPSFTLPGVDGRKHSLADLASSPLLLVVFSCNHCPYAQAWEGRLIEVAREYAPRGLATVVINSNETENYPDDRFEKMVERAREKGYPFPYLRDESQDVARDYGALVTPHPYLFDHDRKLVFQGRIDDDWKNPNGGKHTFLRNAIDASLAGRRPPVTRTAVIGCSIKWKGTQEL